MKNFIRVNIILGFLFLPGLLFGAEFSVNSVAEIQAAFDAAAHNGEDDVIAVSGGTFAVGDTLAFVSKEQYSLEIRGEGGDRTILDGGGQKQVMTINTAETSSRLSHFDFGQWNMFPQRVHANLVGGGGLFITTKNASAAVEYCSFRENTAEPAENSICMTSQQGGQVVEACSSSTAIFTITEAAM